ncbi:hypothetical protein IFM89_037463 [Coptis chinensis]|uniref:Translation initiation factor IF2/IF5 domain-containing protein n=1 Tax=Coptis chinensis TaxID=261450 RepID=A0A835LQH4_9MAGN|nr:hypothetical protein IFM89_037463 [Coptis chinensis]
MEERRERIRARDRQRRAEMTEDERRWYRERRRARDRQRRERMTDEQRVEQRGRETKRELTELEKVLLKERRRARDRQRRQSMTDEERARQRERTRMSQYRKRINLSKEQLEKQKEQRAIAMRRRRINAASKELITTVANPALSMRLSYVRRQARLVVHKNEGSGNGNDALRRSEMPCVALARPASYTTKFLGVELGTQTKFNEKTGVSLVNGAHETAKLAELLETFIKKNGCHRDDDVDDAADDNFDLQCQIHTSAQATHLRLQEELSAGIAEFGYAVTNEQENEKTMQWR